MNPLLGMMNNPIIGEPPAYMLEIWEDKHNHYIDKHAIVKCMIDTYAKA